MSYPITFDTSRALEHKPTRGDILHLQEVLLAMNSGETHINSCPLKHHFAPQVYGREILLPKGITVVGKLHRHAHLNIVLKGHCLVVTEFEQKELQAGDVFVSQSGIKRAVYALEDTVWITVHPNASNTTDLQKIEDYVIAPSYEALAFDKPERISQ